MGKTGVPTQELSTLGLLPANKSSATKEGSQMLKKRKSTGLDRYVDHGMTKEAIQDAHVKLFRYLVHGHAPFSCPENPFFHAFCDSIRPSYLVLTAYVLTHTVMDGEYAQVHLAECDWLKEHKMHTILHDGWEDKAGHALGGTVAANNKAPPVVLRLEDMTADRASADRHCQSIKLGIQKMELNVKTIIAITTDNPTVMQSAWNKLETEYHWILMFPCFLHRLNGIIGKIVSYQSMKRILSGTTHIVSYFNSLHYWGGQLTNEAKHLDIKRGLQTKTDSRWYSLSKQGLSVEEHRLLSMFAFIWTLRKRQMD
ncbi:hypothetical protein D9758_018021 [Tetrapyrgos nigripes]|uniref:DUF659 domain-containing protein n=1 Tax=Tetrapyrgos nigripes TaxID=182062 RepID=A0A8H5BRH8_9AGAR|nr:hypothetical protein D9758_018021 [Tetrapyrgos nigripes]